MSKHVVLFCMILLSISSFAMSDNITLSKKVGYNEDDYWIYPLMKLQNNNSAAIDVSNYSVEFFFYEEDFDGSVSANDYFGYQVWGYFQDGTTSLPKTGFSIEFISLGGTFEGNGKKANVKAVFTFSSHSLETGSYIEFDAGIHKKNWNTFNKSDDWSYDYVSSYQESQNVVVKAGGSTIWGEEPSDSPLKYSLLYDIVGDGTILLSPSGGFYEPGTVVTLTATPNSGSVFVGWMQRGLENSSTLQITMDGNTQITAQFEYSPSSDFPDNLPGNSSLLWKYPESAGPDDFVKMDKSLYTRESMLMGDDLKGHRFIMYSNQDQDFKKKWLELTYENTFDDDINFAQGKGLVLRPVIVSPAPGATMRHALNIGMGTSSPSERLHVNGRIYSSRNDIAVRKNDTSSLSALGMDKFRYYEGLSTGDFHNDSDGPKYGLHLNALSWDYTRDPNSNSTWNNQDPIYHHGGNHVFYTFNKDLPKKENEVARIHQDGTLQLGGFVEGDYTSPVKFPIGNRALLNPDGLKLKSRVYYGNSGGAPSSYQDRAINIDNRNSKISIFDGVQETTEISANEIKTRFASLEGIEFNSAFNDSDKQSLMHFKTGAITNVSDISDGFKIEYNNSYGISKYRDVLVFEKTDGNDSLPDGGIAFVNSGKEEGTDSIVSKIAMFIKGEGNVGIGTDNPTKELDVIGTIKVSEQKSDELDRGSNRYVTIDSTSILINNSVGGGGSQSGTGSGSHKTILLNTNDSKITVKNKYKGETSVSHKGIGFVGNLSNSWQLQRRRDKEFLSLGWMLDNNDTSNVDWSIMNFHPNKSVTIGTETPASNGEKLVVAGNAKVDGTIEANEFKVGEWVITNAPDFVFKDDYDLKPLSEVEKFIKQESHLPGIPSAEEIKNEGFDLVKMNMLLLQKVEELTLHSIEQNKVSNEQKDLILNQQKRIEGLEKKIEEMQ